MTTNLPATLASFGPSITKMIRMDHTHVLLTAHKFEADASLSRKQAIVDAACTALEIHAQLEEEIFYPALRETGAQAEAVEKAPREHDEMRRLIAELRSMRAGDEGFDTTFMTLMRDVLHHVADEETLLLPAAENALAGQLGALGARMTKRRLQLLGPRVGEVAVNTVRAMPASTMLMAGALLTGGWLIGRAASRRHA
jgi:hemerythrin superfamily protein